MAIKTIPFDAARYLDSDEGIAAYLTAAFETDDPHFVADALATAVRAKGITDLARDAGLPRETLCDALAEGENPALSIAVSVMKALEVSLSVKRDVRCKRGLLDAPRSVQRRSIR